MEQDGNHSFPNLRSSFYSAPYEFTMEKVLFVGFLLKERLVINLESLLLVYIALNKLKLNRYCIRTLVLMNGRTRVLIPEVGSEVRVER